MALFVLVGLLSCTVISIGFVLSGLLCHHKIIKPNQSHPAFELRRPYYISFATILISSVVFLRCVVALLFYHSLISIVLYRELFRFLAIFGELQWLILRCVS